MTPEPYACRRTYPSHAVGHRCCASCDNSRGWKPPLAGPEQVLAYLARYTHRVAISNERLVSVTHDEVCFHYRSAAHGDARKIMRLPPAEFLRRFLLHVLPAGFKRIRHYGLNANRSKQAKLARCRRALNAPASPAPKFESVDAFLQRVTGREASTCRYCQHGRLIVVHTLPKPIRLPELHATGPPASS